MGSPVDLLFRLRELGAVISLDEHGQLRCRAPQGVLNAELRSAIGAAKGELISLIRQSSPRDAWHPSSRIETGTSTRLSFAQEGLWLLDRLSAGGSSAYNMSRALRVRGPLDEEILERAIQEIVARHTILRTIFVEHADGPVQIHQAGLSVPLERRLLKAEAVRLEHDIHSILREEARRPFDLARGPLFRALLVRIGDDDCALLLTLHHIVSDGWSEGIIVRELVTLYEAFTQGLASPLAPLDCQYSDFVQWQRSQILAADLTRQLAYWRQRLDGPIERLAFPPRRSSETIEPGSGAEHRNHLSAALLGRLGQVALQHGATLFMVLLSAFAVLLHRYTGQRDIVVGTPFSRRERVEFESLVGLFLNTVALRVDVTDKMTFLEVLTAVKEATLSAHDHADVPFERVVASLQPDRQVGRSPLFQVFFVLQSAADARVHLRNLSVIDLPVDDGNVAFDLTLSIDPLSEDANVSFLYRTTMFDSGTIAALASHYTELLNGVTRAPSERIGTLPMLTGRESVQLTAWNATTAEYTNDLRMHDLFERQVARTPTATALIMGADQMTYSELNQRANHLARQLRLRGVGPERIVGICLPRSFELVIAVLAVWKAGGAYLPLDPLYPTEPIDYMTAVTGLTTIITTSFLSGRFADRVTLVLDDHAVPTATDEDGDVDGRASALNLAWVIFTSGSTGRPKGVMGHHRGSVNHCIWMCRTYPYAPGDVGVQNSSLNVLDSVWEIWAPLSAGMPVVLLSDDSAKDPLLLVRALGEYRVSRVCMVASLLKAVLEEVGDQMPLHRLRLWVASGEPLPGPVAKKFHERLPHATLLNQFGLTETSADCTSFDTRSVISPRGTRATEPIGRPIANHRAHVLDDALNPVPIGVVGELWLGGDGIARGYVGRPDETADRFRPDPFSRLPGGILLRTGDLARFAPDGNIELLGRRDLQLKIRGHRVEPGQIEAALLRHPGVRDALVVGSRSDDGDVRLWAYAVRYNGTAPLNEELMMHLSQQLPEHMVPSGFSWIPEVPRLPNGKVDRLALPSPEGISLRESADGDTPRTADEETVAAIVADVLGVAIVGRTDNFFMLGGHSLLAARVVARIRRQLGVELPLRCIFDCPTVAGISEAVVAGRRQVGAVLQRATPGPSPLSSAQERLWFLERLTPGRSGYHVAGAMRLRGALNVEALEHAFTRLVHRHAALRTHITFANETLTQAFQPSWTISLPIEHVQDIAAATQRIAEASAQPFDLATFPLWRVTLLAIANDDYVLGLVLHHIICDGWSLEVLLQEIGALYRSALVGQDAQLPTLPATYADYVADERDASIADGSADLAYWHESLRDVEPIALCFDYPGGGVASRRGAEVPISLPSSLVSRLMTIGASEGATLFMVLLAGFEALLMRWTGSRDFAIGTPVANRRKADYNNVVGLFVNTLALRSDASVQLTFLELVRRVRARLLDALDRASVPFHQVATVAGAHRDLNETPLFQVFFAMHDASSLTLTLPELQVESVTSPCPAATFALGVAFSDLHEQI